MKQKELSIWLRVTCLFVGLLVLIVCTLVLPSFARELAGNNPDLSYMYAPCLVYAVLASVPIFISLAFAWQIFTDIGRDNSFCAENAKRLKNIGQMFLFEGIYIIAGAVVLVVMDLGHPGIIIPMLFFALLSLGATVICSALSHLTYKAYQMKCDNDLTI